MKFRYAFQKIVDLRENERTQAEWTLSQAIGRLREEERSLTELPTLRDELNGMLVRASEEATTISHVRSLEQYLHHVDRLIRAKREELARVEANVREKQDRLRERMTEERIWQQARTKAYGRFVSELLRREQHELDDMAANRARTFA